MLFGAIVLVLVLFIHTSQTTVGHVFKKHQTALPEAYMTQEEKRQLTLFGHFIKNSVATKV